MGYQHDYQHKLFITRKRVQVIIANLFQVMADPVTWQRLKYFEGHILKC
jgi:hypothetical protein